MLAFVEIFIKICAYMNVLEIKSQNPGVSESQSFTEFFVICRRTYVLNKKIFTI